MLYFIYILYQPYRISAKSLDSSSQSPNKPFLWPCLVFFFFFYIYLLIYLTVPGLSCCMQFLSCNMWDLVLRPGTELVPLR